MKRSCVRRGWVKAVMGASGLLITFAGSTEVMAQAVVPAGETSQAAEQRTFNIPPQPLQSALVLFGQQAGRQVAADGAQIRGVASPGVQGTMSVEEALRRLLAGTGFTYDGAAGAIITVQRLGATGLPPGVMQLDPVQVQGYPVPSQAMIDNVMPPYAGGQVATGGQLGLLGNRGVMDTPFNQTSYTAKKAQDQQAKTVRDVLVDDPSVRNFRSDSGWGDDFTYIRGFPVGNSNISYGGLYGMLPIASIMAEIAERVEVLKGPSVMLNGMPPSTSIGATINIVPKRAPDEDLTQVTANYISASQFGGHADVGRRFGIDKQFGVRFNGVFRGGDTDIQWNTDQRSLAVLGLDFRGEYVRFSADLGYQYQYDGGLMSYLGVANGVPLPWAPSVRSNPGGQPWQYKEYKDLFGVVRAEVDMTERVTAFASFGMHDNRFRGLYSTAITATNASGTATAAAPSNFSSYTTILTGQAGVRGSIDTGPIAHEFSLIGTTFEQQSGIGFVSAPSFATSFYNPTIIAQPNLAMPAANKTSTLGQSSLGIADTLSAADRRIQLTAGLRLQNVTAGNFDAVTGKQTSGYDQSALSPSVALVFKPWQNVSVYGNWIQGLQQGTIVGSTFANAGEVFPPFKSTQYEVGLKLDWGRFTTTASVFQISQPSVLTNVTMNTQFLGGEQRNQGLEINVFGEPMEGVRLLGGVMLLNAVLAKTQGGLTDGWIAPFSPGLNLNLGGEWDLPFVRGMTLNGRLLYTGSQYIDTTWPRRSLPEWTRFDLGMRYAFENPGARGKLIVARFNVENVLDANYWSSGLGAGQLNLGTPRTFRVSLTADF